MKRRQYTLWFAFYCYAGNSTGTSLTWPVADWWGRLAGRLKTEFSDRVESFYATKYADTPVTMTRNLAVKNAREVGADILVMVDSDMHPDMLLGVDPAAEPFFDVALGAIDSHYERGPLVVAAPYGGCPPHENQFVFTWEALGNARPETSFHLRQYTREEARQLHGLHQAAALPTGLIAYDMRAFDYIDAPYFRYEWTDKEETEKASTEDVQNTRDIGLSVQARLGYNPLLAAWSSWAGHNKVWTVAKPQVFGVENISKTFVQTIRKNVCADERLVDVGVINRLNGKVHHGIDAS